MDGVNSGSDSLRHADHPTTNQSNRVDGSHTRVNRCRFLQVKRDARNRAASLSSEQVLSASSSFSPVGVAGLTLPPLSP